MHCTTFASIALFISQTVANSLPLDRPDDGRSGVPVWKLPTYPAGPHKMKQAKPPTPRQAVGYSSTIQHGDGMSRVSVWRYPTGQHMIKQTNPPTSSQLTQADLYPPPNTQLGDRRSGVRVWKLPTYPAGQHRMKQERTPTPQLTDAVGYSATIQHGDGTSRVSVWKYPTYPTGQHRIKPINPPIPRQLAQAVPYSPPNTRLGDGRTVVWTSLTIPVWKPPTRPPVWKSPPIPVWKPPTRPPVWKPSPIPVWIQQLKPPNLPPVRKLPTIRPMWKPPNIMPMWKPPTLPPRWEPPTIPPVWKPPTYPAGQHVMEQSEPPDPRQLNQAFAYSTPATDLAVHNTMPYYSMPTFPEPGYIGSCPNCGSSYQFCNMFGCGGGPPEEPKGICPSGYRFDRRSMRCRKLHID